ncbi:MAG: hypothetical protein RR587_14130 [Solibacillus sp.]
MNKFQKEREKIFGERKLSDGQKRAVIEGVHANEKRKKQQWLPVVVVTAAIGIGSFLLYLTPMEQLPAQTTELNQKFSEESLVEAFKQQWQMNNVEVLYTEVPFTINNDGFFIVKDIEHGGDTIHSQRAKFINNNWEFEEHTVLFTSNLNHWDDFELNNLPYKVGLIQDESTEKIFIGDEEAKIVEAKDGLRVWFGAANSKHTPVYAQSDGKRQHLAEYYTNTSVYVPAIEGNREEQTLDYKGDTMLRGNEEYNKFPLLIDPYYYAGNQYRIGDVIVIERDGELEVTRIIMDNPTEVTLIENTLVWHKFNTPQPFYMHANFDGDTGIYEKNYESYGSPNRDEVMVYPDHWASDGLRGMVSKYDIKGKVLGYDLDNVTNTMTEQELALFNEFQQIVQGMDSANFNEDAIKPLLQDIAPQTVAKLYLYANYLEDYKTMYALFAQSEELMDYDAWIQLTNKAVTKSMKQRLLFEIYAAGNAQLTADEQKIRWTDEFSNEIIYQLPMKKEDGVWKVVYSTVKGNLDE